MDDDGAPVRAALHDLGGLVARPGARLGSAASAGMALLAIALLPAARAARLGAPCALGLGGRAPRLVRTASLAVRRVVVTAGEARGEGGLVDLVGVEPAQLVGEALGDRRGGRAIVRSGWPGWISVREAVLRPHEVDGAALALQPDADMPVPAVGAGQRDRAAQRLGEPAGQQVGRGRVRAPRDGGRR